MGTPSSIVGAYVLVGEIFDNFNRSSTLEEAIPGALHTYEQRFRPFMTTVQDSIEKDKTY